MIEFLTCCFIGHRKIKYSIELERKLTEFIEDLIVNKNVKSFLFGARSEFNQLCYDIVSKLQIKYKHIKMIAYLCKSEDVCLKENKERMERSYYVVSGKKVRFNAYDEIYRDDKLINSGVASYVERNQLMIDKSYYCIFYYDDSFLPSIRKNKKRGLNYQPKSGTKLALDYARQKKKNIVIINEK